MRVRVFALFTCLFGLWFLFHLDFGWVSVVEGVVVSGLVTLLAKDIVFENESKTSYNLRALLFPFALLIEIYRSAFQVLPLILSGNGRSAVVDVTLHVPDGYFSTFIANAITLTPGTITLEKQGNRYRVLALLEDGGSLHEIEQDLKDRFRI